MKADILVSAETLAKHLGDPGWIVFDTRYDLMDPGKGPRAYAQSHIPGAYFLSVDKDLSGAKSGVNGRHPLPDPSTFAARLDQCGVTPESQVVVYDDASGNFALRLWWMLRWLGHGKAALLDGGWPLWVQEGRPVAKDVPPPRPGSFVPRPHLGDTVDVFFMQRFHASPSVRVIDARSAERYAGKNETIDPVAGHIPASVNRFWQKNLEPDGRFKSPEKLRGEFDALLAGHPAEEVVHSCGSGVSACHNAFAMALAGLERSKLYPGSWSEWCADPSRPVARGEEP